MKRACLPRCDAETGVSEVGKEPVCRHASIDYGRPSTVHGPRSSLAIHTLAALQEHTQNTGNFLEYLSGQDHSFYNSLRPIDNFLGNDLPGDLFLLATIKELVE